MVLARPLDNFSEFQQSVSLTDQLPYWDLDDHTMILADGSLVRAFKIGGAAIETWDDEKLNQWCLDLRYLLSGLPDQVEVSFNYAIQKPEERILEQH